MKHITIAFIILLLFLPSVLGATLDLTLNQYIIQGDSETTSLFIQSDSVFDGFVYLSYSNIQSKNVINISRNSFTGSGPYNYLHSWNLIGISPGPYSISAILSYSNATVIDSASLNGFVNSSAPQIISKSPSGIITASFTTLTMTTNEDATCRYSTSNTSSYENMTQFSITGTKTHIQKIDSLSEGSYSYNIRCVDFKGYAMNESSIISFGVDLPASAEISLSDDSPVKAGTIEVTVITSESLDIPPALEYSFNDNAALKKIISLSGSSSLWKGYMIITEEDDNKVGTFYFSGKDNMGNTGNLITKGKVFVVDTAKPPAVINIQAKQLEDGRIKLKWYYEGEPLSKFNIYKSIGSGASYIDYYTSTKNETSYIDYSVTEKVTYYYRIAPVDIADNIGQLSEEVYATSIKGASTENTEEIEENKKPAPDEPKLLPPNLVLKVNDEIKRVQQLDIDVKQIKSDFEQSDSSKKLLIDELGISAMIEEAQSIIKNLNSRLEELKLKYMTSEELDIEIKKIELEEKKIQNTLPKEISLLEDTQFAQSVSEEDVKLAMTKVFSDLRAISESSYLDANKKILESISIEAQAKIINIKYLDQTSQDRTILTKKISYMKPENLGEVIVVEFIPKSISENSDDITFETENYQVLEKDPVIKWGFLQMDFEGKTIRYSINKKISIDKIKEAKSVLLISPAMVEKSNKAVGYSIFSFFNLDSTLSSTEKFFLYLGIFSVIILLGYYLMFIKGGIEKIKLKIKKPNKNENDDKVKISSKSAPFINDENYPELTSINKPSSQEKKEGTNKESVSVRTDNNSDLEPIKKLMTRTQEYLSAEDYEEAALLYQQVQLLYKNLSKEHRQQIYKDCIEIQKSIQKAKEDSYNSLF